MNTRERIVKLVKESGLTQKEFAEAIKAPVTTVNGWFKKDTKSPSADYIIPISELFGVSPEWLLTGEGKTPDDQLSRIEFALSGEIKQLSDIEKQDILDYIRFKKAQRK